MNPEGAAPAATHLRLRIRNERGGSTLTPALVDRLIGTLEAGSGAGVVTLEGEDGEFCKGLDLDMLVESGDESKAALERFTALLDAIHSSPRPVLALVDGAALGGGVGLAAAADLVIASPRATFGLPEALFGLAPALVFPEVARRMGSAHARWLALGVATLSANEAWRLGLVDDVADDLERALDRCCQRLGRMDPRALAEVKSLAATHEAAPQSYRTVALETFHRLSKSPAARERIRRFLAGEAPWPEADAP